MTTRWIAVKCETCNVVLPVMPLADWLRTQRLPTSDEGALAQFKREHDPAAPRLARPFEKPCKVVAATLEWNADRALATHAHCDFETEPGMSICGRPTASGTRCADHAELSAEVGFGGLNLDEVDAPETSEVP